MVLGLRYWVFDFGLLDHSASVSRDTWDSGTHGTAGTAGQLGLNHVFAALIKGGAFLPLADRAHFVMQIAHKIARLYYSEKSEVLSS